MNKVDFTDNKQISYDFLLLFAYLIGMSLLAGRIVPYIVPLTEFLDSFSNHLLPPEQEALVYAGIYLFIFTRFSLSAGSLIFDYTYPVLKTISSYLLSLFFRTDEV